MNDQPKTGGAAAYANARSRSEAKNQAVRDALEPLAPGERPGAVTVAAVVAALLSAGNVVTYLLSDHAKGADGGREIFQMVMISAVLAVAAWGMWRAKYWAVLGFQTLLGLQAIVMVLSLMRADSALAALIFLAVIALSAILFWYLIRAMARLQMPESPEERRLREQREDEQDG